MEDKEDGEVSDNNSECDITNVYNPFPRPERPNSTMYRNVNKAVLSSEDDSDSSDSEFAPLLKRKRVNNNQSLMEVDRNGFATVAVQPSTGARKKNNIWANVIEEESLTQEIGGVALKKINTDRDVESYDYTNALIARTQSPPVEETSSPEEFDMKETFEDTQRRMNRKRRFHERLGEVGNKTKPKQNNNSNERNLINISLDSKLSDLELGCLMAEALYEHKAELIVRVVETLGQELALNIYNKTKQVEKDGGMMILNGGRRRTSGGVFLQLLKNFDGVEKNHLTQIFTEDNIQWRKRKRVNRRRHNSKPQGAEKTDDDGLHLKGLFSDDPGGTMCPGSTPVTTPQGSDEEDETLLTLPVTEVCEKVAQELSRQSEETELHPPVDDMDVF